MKNFFSTLILTLLFFNAQAQKSWTLSECVDYALLNNIQVKQSELQTQANKITKDQRFAAMLPSFNADVSQNFSYGRSVDPVTNISSAKNNRNSNFSISTGITIFNGFQLQNSLKQSGLDYMASRYDLDKIKNDISMNVVAAYLQVLYNNENLQQNNNRVAALKKQRDQTQQQVTAGNLAQGNLYEMEAQLANEELAQVNAENELKQSYLSLTQLLNLESSADFIIIDPKTELPEQTVLTLAPEAIYATATTVMPEIKSADVKLKSSEKGIAIAKGAHYPRLTAYGSLGTVYSNNYKQFDSSNFTFNEVPFDLQMDNNFSQGFGFTLSIPIFNGLQTKSNVSRSKITMQNSAYTLDLEKQILYKSIQQAHTDASASRSRLDASQRSLTATQTSFDYTQKKFNAGLLTSLDFITAQNNLTKSQSDVLQAKYDFIFRLKILDFYMGKPLGM